MMTPTGRTVDSQPPIETAPTGRNSQPRPDASKVPIALYPSASDMPEPQPPAAPREEDSEETELMARVRWGDAAAFEQVVERFWGRTFLYAQSMVGDRDRAADIAQEAFTRLWQKRAEWRPSGSVGVWLLRTARNLVVSEQRKWKVRTRWALTGGRDSGKRPPTPLQEVEREELRVAMKGAIEKLSPRRREVFTLFHLQGFSYREVAEIMEIRPQTVANYLQAALADLRLSLAPFFPSFAEGSGAPQADENT